MDGDGNWQRLEQRLVKERWRVGDVRFRFPIDPECRPAAQRVVPGGRPRRGVAPGDPAARRPADARTTSAARHALFGRSSVDIVPLKGRGVRAQLAG